MPLDLHGFNAPPIDFSGLYHTADTLERRNQFKHENDYRHQKDLEEQQWKKLGMIKDLTDLSKHQTGSDVANAIGNQKANEILQKYTQMSGSMSPTELQGNISKEMSGAINGMEGVKNELTTADEQIKQLKAANPDLDIASLAKDARSDILHRRLDDNAGFVNPMAVPQSQINLADPEFLSRYVTGDKNLRSYFQNPQGMDEMSVFKGSPNSYTKYTAKVPSYKKANFDPATLKSGFLPNNTEPQLQFKSSTLPVEAMPSSKGKPFEVIDKDIYDGITGKEKLELIGVTRNQVPGYDQMNQQEKEYAQRHVLLKTAKAYDQTGFHPTEVHTPSAAMMKFYAGGSGSDSKKTNQIDLTEYPDVDGGKDITKLMQGIKVTGLPDGSSLLAKEVIYNPNTKKVTFTEYGKGGTTKTLGLKTFLQNIVTNNPGTDMKFLEGLWNPIGVDKKQEPKTEIPKVKTTTKSGLPVFH